MPELLRFTQLSTGRQALLRLFQSVNYGQIRSLTVRGGEPVFDPAPVVLFDLKLDSAEESRPEAELQDFVVRQEVVRLFSQLESLHNGTIERIDIRAGIPRRLVLERQINEVSR